MRTLRIALLTAVVAMAGILSATAQTADEIIQKHLDALGGLDKWKNVQTMKLLGSITAQGMEMPLTITTEQGKGMKVEFSMNGITGYQIVTDKAGWNYMPFGGQTKPEAMPDEMVKQMQDGLDIQGALVDYKAKGSKVVYLGKDDVEGTDCYKLKVTRSNGKEETMYIDATNYYHIRSKSKLVANGKEVEETSNYGNFQKLPEGIVIPMTLDDGNGPVAFKTVEVNKPLAADVFKPTDTGTKN